MFLSKRWRVAFRRATSKPPLSKWLWVLKDAGLSHLSVPLLVKVSRGQQPWETLVVPVDPSGELDFAPRATREQRSSRTSAAHTSRVALAPGKNYGAIDSKVTFRMPPAEPFARTFASPREWLHHERSVPPRTDLSLRGLVVSPYEEPFASAKRPTTCEWPLPGVKGHIPTKRTFHGRFNDLCHCGDVSPRETLGESFPRTHVASSRRPLSEAW